MITTELHAHARTTIEIWDCMKTKNEGYIQVKESKVDMLITQCENYSMK